MEHPWRTAVTLPLLAGRTTVPCTVALGAQRAGLPLATKAYDAEIISSKILTYNFRKTILKPEAALPFKHTFSPILSL